VPPTRPAGPPWWPTLSTNGADRLDARSVAREERTVKGSYIGSCVPIRDVPRYVELYRQGRLPVDRLLSERVRLDQLNEAFDRLASGRTIRQVLVV
jgi:alcohol dehydrogenase